MYLKYQTCLRSQCLFYSYHLNTCKSILMLQVVNVEPILDALSTTGTSFIVLNHDI